MIINVTPRTKTACRQVFAVALFAIFASVFCSGQSVYFLKDLGSLTGESTSARKINIDGSAAAVSGSRDGARSSAAIWRGNRLTMLTQVPGADYSEAGAINDKGDLAGVVNLSTNMLAAFWSAQGGVQTLGTLPGDSSSRAFGINNSGQVVGFSSGPKGVRAFIWSLNTGMKPLPATSNRAEAYGTNNHGQIVGMALIGTYKHAVVWNSSNEQPRDLGILPNHISSRAVSISDAGDIVGSSTGPYDTCAFRHTASGISALPGLPATAFSDALGINNRGQVVGTFESSFGNHAFVWSQARGFEDLNEIIPSNAGVVLTLASDVNDRGQIIAIGVPHYDLANPSEVDSDEDAHGLNIHSYLLTPTSRTEH